MKMSASALRASVQRMVEAGRLLSQQTDMPVCHCDYLMGPEAKQTSGPHHEEGCSYFQLPDYGHFGPDD